MEDADCGLVNGSVCLPETKLCSYTVADVVEVPISPLPLARIYLHSRSQCYVDTMEESTAVVLFLYWGIHERPNRSRMVSEINSRYGRDTCQGPDGIRFA